MGECEGGQMEQTPAFAARDHISKPICDHECHSCYSELCVFEKSPDYEMWEHCSFAVCERVSARNNESPSYSVLLTLTKCVPCLNRTRPQPNCSHFIKHNPFWRQFCFLLEADTLPGTGGSVHCSTSRADVLDHWRGFWTDQNKAGGICHFSIIVSICSALVANPTTLSGHTVTHQCEVKKHVFL